MQTLSSAPDPAVSVAVTILAVLLALTGFGLWTAFGPKAAKLTDPWDDHDDQGFLTKIINVESISKFTKNTKSKPFHMI